MSNTPTLNLNKQDKGASNWHVELNLNFDKIDSALEPFHGNFLREGVDEVSMVRDTNRQTFRVYNTRTDSQNWERGALEWVAGNEFWIRTQRSGTGQNRFLRLDAGAGIQFGLIGVAHWTMDSNGLFKGEAGKNLSLLQGYFDFGEMTLPSAPAANTGRLFVRDNGSGKSQLCIRFNTGAEQVIATEP